MMLGRLLATTTLTCLTLVPLSGCNNSGFNGQTKDGPVDDNEGEDSPGDQSPEIAGTFLTCSYINAPSDSDNGDKHVGCGVYTKSGKARYDQEQLNLSLFDSNNVRQNLDVMIEPEDSPFHKIAKLPFSAQPGDYLAMAVENQGSSSVFKTQIRDILPAGTLVGTSTEDRYSSYYSSQLGKMKSFEFHAMWKMGAVGSDTDILPSDNFCDSTGAIADTADPAGVLVGMIMQAGGATTEIVKKPGFVDQDTKTCFRNFKLPSNFERSYVHTTPGGGCLLARTDGDAVLIISLPLVKDRGLTRAALTEFVTNKACP